MTLLVGSAKSAPLCDLISFSVYNMDQFVSGFVLSQCLDRLDMGNSCPLQLFGPWEENRVCSVSAFIVNPH